MKMNLNQEQYERIALWLDGEDVALSGEERAEAESIRQCEKQVAPLMDTPVEADTLRRVHRTVSAGAVKRSGRRIRLVIGGAAAAAAIVLAVVLSWPHQPSGTEGLPPAEDDIMFGSALETSSSDEIAILSDEIDSLEANIIADGTMDETEFRIDAMRQEVNEFWMDYQPGMDLDEPPAGFSG